METYIPQEYRSIFKFDELNSVQTVLCDEIFFSSRSLVVSAPTGCGKTVIFELNIIKYLIECTKIESDEISCVLYIAPLKSLCTEKFVEWEKKFAHTTMTCILSTGDSEPLDWNHLMKRTLIVTTPEKLDGFIKSSEEGCKLLKSIRYCFVDEFCTTRRSTIQVARDLTKNNKFSTGMNYDALRHSYAAKVKDQQLKTCLANGVGYHHAGLETADRQLVEQAFLSGCLPVLASTSTLSMGLNLPAHLVIIKNTEQVVNGELKGYNSTQIAQMVGRAGRPQFDTEGVAVIMTSNELKAHYERLYNQSDLIESNLHKKLTDHINTEVALGTVTSLDELMWWLNNSFLYVRIKKAPHVYDMPYGVTQNFLDSHLQMICENELKQLQKLGLVSYDEESTQINKTELGTLVMKNHLNATTAQMIWELKGEETLEDLVNFVASCAELKDIPLRNNEKTLLNTMNRTKGRESLRYPLPGRIVTVPMKIACLLQSHLSGNMIRDSSLQHDAVRIVRCAKRIANVLAGLLWLDVDDQSECTKGTVLPADTTTTLSKHLPLVCSTYKCMVSIMELKKTLQLGTWLNRPLVSLASCPLLTSKDIDKLITSRLLTTGQIEKVQPTDLDQILDKPAPIAEQLLNYIRGIPNYSLDIEKLDSSHCENEVIRFCIKVSRMCAMDTVFVLVGDAHNKLIAKHQFQSWKLVETSCQKEIMICKRNEGQRISFTVCSTNFAGVDLHTSFVLPPSEQNEAQVCDSSTNAHLPPSLTEISVGYAEDLAEDLSTTYPNALHLSTMHWVSTTPLSQPVSQNPTFPQPPKKKPKKVPSFKFARKRPSDANSTSDFTPKSNTTFTWIPAAPNSTPRAPLIQTSMLDYMRSQEASTSLDTNTSTKENTPVDLNPDKPAHSSMVIDTTNSSDADKKRRFHWSLVGRSNQSFEEPEQDNHIWRNAHETTPALVSNTSRTTWTHCDSYYTDVDRDIDYKSTRTANQEIVYSAGNDESQTSEHNPCESISTLEVKPNDEQVTSSQNEVEEIFEAVFEQWEHELPSSPNKPGSQKCELPISEVSPGQQKDGTPVPDFRSACLHSKPNTFPPPHPKGSEQTFCPETNTSTVHPTTQTTPIHARYIREGSDGIKTLYTPLVLTQTNRYQETRPRFSITPIGDVFTGGMTALIPTNTTTKLSSTIYQKEQKFEKSPPEFKVPGNVRFEKLVCRWEGIHQPPEAVITSSSELSGTIDFELINSGWPELACWIRVNEICQYHGLDGRLSDQTEGQPTQICDTPLWRSHQESMEINRNVMTKVCLGQNGSTDNIPSNGTKMPVDLDEYHNNSASIEE
ncbi:hypothetical protein EG68_07047 [Paragonimus skrjabini miyazakii]|uniref:DNA 3'-5' helicase n=1 Tax=Paragonimus skrjabini miyazakii TaxID=59628 RepID=A0A8S9YVD0_9TREM|nr:hypothetical protein EG68_07047 [Paragonimus skrjabini miyazakii]